MRKYNRLRKIMKKLNISDTEREILEENAQAKLEDYEEDYFDKYHKKLTAKQKKDFIEKFIIDNAEVMPPKMRQVEKEEAQLKCILDYMGGDGRNNSTNVLTLEEMSELLKRSGFETGTSVKTIYRRMRPELFKKGVEQKGNKYYYIRKSTAMNQEAVNEHYSKKLEELTIISNFLETIKDSPVYEKAKQFVENQIPIIDINKNESDNSLLDSASRVIFLGAPAAKIQFGIWDSIYKAFGKKCYIIIDYQAEGRFENEKYVVKPYQLIFDNGIWELWGDCKRIDHKGLKLFNLSRISNVELIENAERFVYSSEFDFRKTLKGNFGCYTDNELKLYRIRFLKGSYAYLYSKDRIWGENQSFEETGDGYVLTFEASQYKPILRWVLGWGSEVVPLEPEQLVAEWKENIKKLQKYL